MNFIKAAVNYAELVKLGHTLFALPFALSALCLAKMSGFSFGAEKIFWTVAAFAGARAAAMGFNRIVDREFDALNPRTKTRPSVTGKISMPEAKLFTAVSIAVFIFSAAMINFACFALSFPALAVLLGYSYAKRFTCAAHYIVGVALGLAPAGAWIAAADSFDPRILSLSFALLFNIAAFDLIYALDDMQFDRAHNLHSIPARFGRGFSLALAAASFAAAAGFLILAGTLFGLNAAYYACVGTIALLYVFGIFAILKYGGQKTQLVFFYENVSVSIMIFAGIAANLF
ncbi:MAG: 4-hydroxybenzoate octaprenyltransferase [Opitutales bacterium]|nr:4-hydroxybenzoate octaprenyltransferase [Opitutales bacterium]